MSDISATIRLRPIRIALVVRPTDVSSIRKFMRISACLWGGVYNPIIPVFRSRPKEWRNDTLSGVETARGYVEFFEPEAFVEAEPKLLERAGLGAIRDLHGMERRVMPLNELLRRQSHRDWAELEMGLGIIDVLRHVYENERRFKLRDERPAYLVKSERGSTLVEAVFGSYPPDHDSQYIRRAYRDVYKPECLDASPNAWLEIYQQDAVTPLELTRYHLQANRQWHHRNKFYVFNPERGPDLIDLWNLRLELKPLLPIPIAWWPDLADEVRKWIRTTHGGGPPTTIEFARSVDAKSQREVLAKVKAGLPKGSVFGQGFRNPVWEGSPRGGSLVPGRPLRVTAKERNLTLSVHKGKPPVVEFQTLSPEFASLFGGHGARWTNVVNVRSAYSHDVAAVLPFNVLDPNWPRLGDLEEKVVVGTEGWSFGQEHVDSQQTIKLLTQDEAIIGSLKQLGVEASLSEPGRIAKQILQHLGGIRGIHLLRDPDTLRLLNKMAGGVRRRVEDGDQVEELFDRRVRSEAKWRTHLGQRSNRRPLPKVELEHFTQRQVIRLGLSTKCPRCTASNWHSLSAVDYEVACERCLEHYAFPQGALRAKNGNWSYRAIGPFSTPDYARGSYGALLALNVLDRISISFEPMTFSPALSIDKGSCEVDYVAWVGNRWEGEWETPELVIGEAKSFGEGDLIEERDLARLRDLAKRLPGATVVISVMRDEFSRREKRILSPFVTWGRRSNKRGLASNPVILLTGVELFHQRSLGRTWEKRGGLHGKYSDHEHWRSLRKLAEATQAIYLP